MVAHLLAVTPSPQDNWLRAEDYRYLARQYVARETRRFQAASAYGSGGVSVSRAGRTEVQFHIDVDEFETDSDEDEDGEGDGAGSGGEDDAVAAVAAVASASGSNNGGSTGAAAPAGADPAKVHRCTRGLVVVEPRGRLSNSHLPPAPHRLPRSRVSWATARVTQRLHVPWQVQGAALMVPLECCSARVV